MASSTTAEVSPSSFDYTKKKKKKPSSMSTTSNQEEITIENTSMEENTLEQETLANPELPSLDFTGKKKKKPSSSKKSSNPETDAETTMEASAPLVEARGNYDYEQLAERIYSLLHSKNIGVRQTRQVLPPPILHRIGKKKTGWANFLETCQCLRRKPEHMLHYILTELVTEGSIDGSYCLIIKGVFKPNQIEHVIRHYISEYVVCKTCNSADTDFKKENRLYFVCCKICSSTRSVAAIKKGFEAQVGRRNT